MLGWSVHLAHLRPGFYSPAPQEKIHTKKEYQVLCILMDRISYKREYDFEVQFALSLLNLVRKHFQLTMISSLNLEETSQFLLNLSLNVELDPF